MHIASVECALPPHRYTQEQILAAFRSVWGARHANADRVDRLHRAVLVGARNLALPLEAYPALRGFGEANAAWTRVATELGEAAARRAIDEAGLSARDVDAIYFTTVTGVAAPSVDARLVARLGLREDVKRVPIFGLGCVAGAAATARVAEYLRAFPGDVALLVAVELCSLTVQRGDVGVANLIATGLFGDGAAALVGVGAERALSLRLADEAGAARPRVVGSRSRLYPETEDVMGWDVGDSGFRVVLAASVPDVVRRYIREDVDAFLAAGGLARRDIAAWICHPGGPKVIEAVGESLELDADALAPAWRSLAEVGNLSGASVLFVLRDVLARRPAPPPGAFGLMLALGPGFCSELVLLQW